MGMTIEVEAETADEWKALQSEGAPWIHVSYGRAAELFDLFGVRPEGDDWYSGVIDPDDILYRQDVALWKASQMPSTWVLTETGGKWVNVHTDLVNELVRIAQVASNLRRSIGFG